MEPLEHNSEFPQTRMDGSRPRLPHVAHPNSEKANYEMNVCRKAHNRHCDCAPGRVDFLTVVSTQG
jgi:hypothetical protein